MGIQWSAARENLATRNETHEEASVIKCWKLACVILGLDAVMHAPLFSAFLSGNRNRSKCQIWWIPSTLSALFSCVTLFALVYMMKRFYSIGNLKLLFTASVFIFVSVFLMGAFPLSLCWGF
ncbi:hypothetical protein SUGI_1010990 [Cryptomeria japonica]|uniref:uncharacterized protein LOC131032959 n=1 Tax=Cryptomeria japonica TaxID=3369 RepID=UPI002414BBE0|nr:uncharacterized protein LOC131032959 [Cryptomeria japonica]GLJ47875.1 hypothetical protein SUGI_1010990 [Cryptomeria japonica]